MKTELLQSVVRVLRILIDLNAYGIEIIKGHRLFL